MPRRGGHNPSGNRRKHLGHRMHRKTRQARRAARVNRTPVRQPWDPTPWLERLALSVYADTGHIMAAPQMADILTAADARPQMGRKNKPPQGKPQKPKRPKGGSKHHA